MAGYSTTPLIKKLGIKEGYTILLVQAPVNYFDLISPLPPSVQVVAGVKPNLDFIHLFVTSNKTFEKEFLRHKKLLKKNGMLWVSWPKKASMVETDLDENKIREYGLAHGLADVKVCAVDDVWSGLKFVYRLEDR